MNTFLAGFSFGIATGMTIILLVDRFFNDPPRFKCSKPKKAGKTI